MWSRITQLIVCYQTCALAYGIQLQLNMCYTFLLIRNVFKRLYKINPRFTSNLHVNIDSLMQTKKSRSQLSAHIVLLKDS